MAAQTKRIRLGTGIMQLAGRPPAMAAMQIQTVDALAGGNRVIAGFGVSGPQIVEGWYGQPWGNPYWRLRDYIQIIRKINLREGPVSHQGREISLPYTGEGATGLGKPLSSILHPNPDLPLWMGCGGEASVKLAAELCDGWLPHGFVPGRMGHFAPWVEEGFRRAGNGKSWKDFEIQGGGSVQITDDVAGAIRAAKPNVALYVGGMGHRTMNFHKSRCRNPDMRTPPNASRSSSSLAERKRPSMRCRTSTSTSEPCTVRRIGSRSAGEPGKTRGSPASRCARTRRKPCD